MSSEYNNVNHNYHKGKRHSNIDGEKLLHPEFGGLGILGLSIKDDFRSNQVMWQNRNRSEELAYSGHQHANEPQPALPLEYSTDNFLNSRGIV